MGRLFEANKDRENRDLKKDGDPELRNTQLFLPNHLALMIYDASTSAYRLTSIGNSTEEESV